MSKRLRKNKLTFISILFNPANKNQPFLPELKIILIEVIFRIPNKFFGHISFEFGRQLDQ